MSRAQRNFALSTIAAGAILGAGWFFVNRHTPVSETEIYRGVTYECVDFPTAAEVRGAMHLIRLDLSAPGVSIFVTPMNDSAIARGFEYRLDYVSRVVKQEHLAAAINGGYFAADSRFVYSAGDFAVSTETAVADHRPSHDNLNSYLLWLDDELTPHMEYNKPPAVDSLRRARWGISSQMVVLNHSTVNAFAPRLCDKRTAVGFNAEKRMLYLAVFEHASPSFVAETLRDRAATDAIMLDGGTSTSMAIGSDAAHISGGSVLGGWRPVATVMGVRAEPLPVTVSVNRNDRARRVNLGEF